MTIEQADPHSGVPRHSPATAKIGWSCNENQVRVAFSSARCVAGTGPIPMIDGSTPAVDQLRVDARIRAPRNSASSRQP